MLEVLRNYILVLRLDRGIKALNLSQGYYNFFFQYQFQQLAASLDARSDGGRRHVLREPGLDHQAHRRPAATQRHGGDRTRGHGHREETVRIQRVGN